MSRQTTRRAATITPRYYERFRARVLAQQEVACEVLRKLDDYLKSDPALSGTSTVEELFRNIKERVVSVAMFGNFSTGKSTFVNTLLSRPGLLKQESTSTTATLTKIKYGSEPSAEIVFRERFVLGPLDKVADVIQEKQVLDELIEFSELDERPIQQIHNLDYPDSPDDKPVSIQKIRDRKRYLDKNIQDQPSSSPWRYLRLTLKPRENIPVKLGPHGERGELHKWIARGARSMWLEKVIITVPEEALNGMVIYDTPGIDSVQPHHAQLTRRMIKQANAAVFTFRADNPEVHNSTVRAYQKLFKWLDYSVPARLFHLGTHADYVVDEERWEFNGDIQKAQNQIRCDLQDGFKRAIEESLASKMRKSVDSTVNLNSIYLVNAENRHDEYGEFARFWQDLKNYLVETQGMPALKDDLRSIIAVVENRFVILNSLVKDFAAAVEKDNLDALERRQKRLNSAAENVKELRSSLDERLAKKIDDEVGSMKRWVKKSFTKKADAERLKSKWKKKAQALVESINGKFESSAEALEDELNRALESQETKLRIRNMRKSSGLAVDKDKLEEVMSGFGWVVKGFIDFFGTRLRKKNIDEAKRVALSQLDDVESNFQERASKGIDRLAGSAEEHLTDINSNIEVLNAEIEELKGDREAREERLKQWQEQVDNLEDTRDVLTEILSKRK